MSDQLEPRTGRGDEMTEGEEDKKEVEKRVLATTMVLEVPGDPVVMNKYPVVLPYVTGMLGGSQSS